MTPATETTEAVRLPAPLEQVELEMALGTQDVLRDGFAMALSHATKAIDGEVLFDLPCSGDDTCQRVAGLVAGGEVMIAHLGPDGHTVTISAACTGHDAFSRFAMSQAALLGHLSAIESLSPAKPLPA